MNNRICILCTPRSGSQICANIITEHVNGLCLGEYFESWNQHKYEILSGKMTYIEHNVVKSIFGISDNYNNKLDMLSKANIDQPLILNLFILEQYDRSVLLQIIHTLRDLNFQFIQLKRNDIRAQMLSYIIANHNGTFLMNSKVSMFPANIQHSKKLIDYLYPSFKNFDNNVTSLLGDIPSYKVEFESFYNDLGKIYNTNFAERGTKTVIGDPLDLFINKDEMISLLNEYGK